eukprot:CAMPEP_0181042658 /NCGR_PEP_ID=MMETSP1070-20121207/12274_1 /TAXON_ID=265543 /ORGANISM="Minutocellus polymorphus, Strain NH13" /LENGTH=653 /DNA_ID=CAMNT_0023120899 /DNA_START=119 /DNA_END=2080 /DNA_ORIENTATION=+
MTASFSCFVGAPSLLLLLLLSTLETPASSFVPNPLAISRAQSQLCGAKSDDNEKKPAQDVPDTPKNDDKNKKKKNKRSVSYDVGSGQNKPLDHLRKRDTNTTASDDSQSNEIDAALGEMNYQFGTLTDVEFWGAGYVEGGPSETQKPRIPSAPQVYDKSSSSKNDGGTTGRAKSAKKKSTARYDLGMNKHSPIISGAERRRTRKLIAAEDDGEFLSRATGSGGTTSLSGLSRVEKEKSDSKPSKKSNAVKEAEKKDKRQPHHVEGWDEIENDTKRSGLVGAHIDGGATPPSSVPPARSKINDASSFTKLEEPHADDEAVEAAAAAYVSALLNGDANISENREEIETSAVQSPTARIDGPVQFEDIDLSVPLSVYDPDNNVDLVWDLMRYEANEEAIREPILVSFLHSTILNHPTLESALAFHLANKLSAPAMIATQIMTLMKEALDASFTFRRSLRADILAVRDRDPACEHLPDVFLYFKGFHSLESYRVANHLWKTGRTTLAHYLQSQVSQTFQIDIHPNATIQEGVMLDHGTGIVIGETAHVGHNCSILHHVTLGGSGKKGVDRHPKVGNGVLLGAGCSALGDIRIGDGCQVGAGTLVIEDLPDHSVAVGVPARVIGTFVDVATQPAREMCQLGSKESDEMIQLTFESEGI